MGCFKAECCNICVSSFLLTLKSVLTSNFLVYPYLSDRSLCQRTRSTLTNAENLTTGRP